MMRKQAFWIITAACVTGVALGSAEKSQAEDGSTAGVVRISDKSSDSIQRVSHRNVSGSSRRQPVVARTIIFQKETSSNGCSTCGTPTYQNGHGFSHGQHFYVEQGPLSNMFTPDNSCTYSPGHGWSRPVAYPIERRPVEYQRFWPTRWYGQPGGGVAANAQHYPTVYQPTDTTQMGYYYQAVPQWRPNPSMVPPSPWPPYWHRREFPHDPSRNVTIGDVTIGDVDGRRYYGPQQVHPQFAPNAPQAENSVPPSPAGAINSASNVELEAIPN